MPLRESQYVSILRTEARTGNWETLVGCWTHNGSIPTWTLQKSVAIRQVRFKASPHADRKRSCGAVKVTVPTTGLVHLSALAGYSCGSSMILGGHVAHAVICKQWAHHVTATHGTTHVALCSAGGGSSAEAGRGAGWPGGTDGRPRKTCG